MKRPNWFLYSIIVYFVAYFLPAMGDIGKDPLFGIQCAIYATFYMFSSPIFFVGNLSNIMVVIVFVLKLLKKDSLQRLSIPAKVGLMILMLVAVGIWAVFFELESLNIGYYLWAFACLGILYSYLFTKPKKNILETDMIDHLID